MKFVTMLNLNEKLTLETCQRMIDEFDKYMEAHPAIPEVSQHFVDYVTSLIWENKEWAFTYAALDMKLHGNFLSLADSIKHYIS